MPKILKVSNSININWKYKTYLNWFIIILLSVSLATFNPKTGAIANIDIFIDNNTNKPNNYPVF